MSEAIRSGNRPRRALAALLGAGLLTAGLVGCGGGGDHRDVILPPGGVAVGNIVCANSIEPPTTAVAHGQTITIRFTLTDVNVALAGANLPISFDVIGGTVLNPPTHTDVNGLAIVQFLASDPTFVGAARVRLIQPDARLDCDAAFTVYQPACILRSEVLDGNDAVVRASDACGSTEFDVERQVTRKIRYRVTRMNPFTHVEEPVAGANLRLRANGLSWSDVTVGPTNAGGTFTQTITPFPTGEGVAVVVAEVVEPDVDGTNNAPDGVPDSLPCNTCAVGFNIVNPICAADGTAIVPTYRDAFGTAKAAPLRPGESADLEAWFVVDGVPQAGRTILVDAADGYVNGSSTPVRVLTNGAGRAIVRYTARDGFSGNDVVTFQDDLGTLQCTQTATIAVVTCDFHMTFGAPVTSGADVPLTIHVVNVDPATAVGQTVALDVTGGYFTQQPPYYQIEDMGGGMIGFTTMLHVTPGFSGPAQLSVSYVTGYACGSVTKGFTVTP